MAVPTQVIIIGTGWAGVAAAKTYLQINPSISLTLLTNESTVGGVWSKDRLYPNLIANSPNGLYEFSDLSMVDADNPEYELVPGERVQEYLHTYAVKYDLLSRIKFNTKVTKAVRRVDVPGWTLTLESGETLNCDKLILSSGLYSKPKWPSIPQEPSFKGTVIHSRTLGAQHKSIIASGARDIIIVGGCKSAVEACTLFLESSPSITVHWVIRPTAQGVPILLADPEMKPNFVAIAQTRLFGVLGPSIFNTSGFWYRFLHRRRNWLGRKIFDGFWSLMSKIVKAGPQYTKSENGRKIEPKGDSLFWDSAYISLLYKDSRFLKTVHEGQRIKVYRDTPTRLSNNHMSLASGTSIRADAVVYCTGWTSSTDFFSPEDATQLGIPVPIADNDDAHWTKLMADANFSVRESLPFLANEARPASETPAHTQFRMYRQVLSPQLLAQGDRSIAFAGFISTGQTAVANELLSLWAVAWLEGLLPCKLPSEEDMEREVARVNCWMARRYGAPGARDPAIVLEVQGFFDVLMQDFGLEVKRKRGWLKGLREWVVPYTSGDYKGVVDEFLERIGKGSEKGD
jgi:dimethylaniline monooxygenase (N-oxide forming)